MTVSIDEGPDSSLDTDSEGSEGRRLRIRPLLAGAIATVIIAGFAVFLAIQLLDARHQFLQAKAVLNRARTSLAHGDADQARASIDIAGGHVAAARGDVASPLFKMLAVVPLVGSPVRAVQDGARAGEEALTGGRMLADVATDLPTSGRATVNGHELLAFHDASLRTQQALDAAEPHLAASRRIVARMRGAILPPVASSARQFETLLDSAQNQLDGARRGLGLVAGLTAPTTDVRLLILSQGTTELRATGGFIGSVGVLHFSHGTVNLERYDAVEALPLPDPPVTPPPDLASALARAWNISNANWWPDFPTTARTARDLYGRQGGGDVAGVLAITDSLVGRLVGALGPIQVSGYAKPVTGTGFIDRLLYEVEEKSPQDTPKKRFIIELSKILFGRIFALNRGDVQPVAKTLADASGTGDFQAWFADPAYQQYVTGTTWAGELPHVNRDFLMLVDSNLSASKANRYVNKEVTYSVKRVNRNRAFATLHIKTRDSGDATRLNPYYNGFLRIYVPKGTELWSSGNYQVETGDADDGPYQVFSLRYVVEPKETVDLEIQYLLPSSVVSGGQYGLTWMRQAGTTGDKLRAVIRGTATDVLAKNREFEASRNFNDPAWRRLARKVLPG